MPFYTFLGTFKYKQKIMIVRQNIDFKKIAAETGVRKGKIFNSLTWKSWVVSGHPEIDLICIEPPHKEGDLINGNVVKAVKIENNQWVFNCT